MQRRIQIIILLLFVPVLLFAGTTGKIAGVVKDADADTPLPGANVIIVGSTLGAACNMNGEYFIINVPVGTYEVKASMMGYQAVVVQQVKVTVDHTTNIDFSLKPTVLEMEDAVIVTAEREVIQKDMTMSRQIVSGKEIFELPLASFQAAAQLSTGAVSDHFRGGRANETLTMVDGLSIKDPLGGYFGGMDGKMNTGSGLNLDVPEYAIEEMEVLTGGFNAEYGNAQSGVMNLITKVGGPKTSGTIRVSTFAPESFNSISEKSWFRDKDLNLSLIPDFTDSNGVVHQGSRLGNLGYNDVNGVSESQLTSLLKGVFGSDKVNAFKGGDLEFSLSGPLPLITNLLPGDVTYSVNGDYSNLNQGQFAYQGGQTNGALQAKLMFKLSPNYKLLISGIGSFQNDRDLDFDDDDGTKYPGGYYPGLGTIYPSSDKGRHRRWRNWMGQIKWTHTLSTSAYYEISLGARQNAYKAGVKDYNDRDGDGDYKEYLKWGYRNAPDNPADPNTTWHDELLFYTDDTDWVWVPADEEKNWAGGWKWGVPGKSDWEKVWYVPLGSDEWMQEWRYLTGDNYERELEPYPVPTYNESDIYGVPNQSWAVFGDAIAYNEMQSDVYSLRLDYVNQVTHNHLIKTGIQFEYNKLDHYSSGFFSLSNHYIDDWTEDPYDIAFYLQDKIEVAGMIVNAGIRFDYYNPNGFTGDDLVYPGDFINPVDRSLSIDDPDYIQDPQTADGNFQISPRLGISHPITDNDVLHFTYGHFFQRPEYRYIYENSKYDFEAAYEEMGNPGLEPEKTIAYEVGIEHRFSQDWLIDVTGFYKDIQNLVSQIEAGTAPFTNFWLYSNADYANVRGFELSLKKMYSKFFSGQLNYTYMIAKGRASDPQDGGTFLWRKQLMPKEDQFLNFDQRHTVNLSLNLRIPKTWGPKILGFQPLGDWTLNILSTYGSGLPYTSAIRTVVPPVNDKRMPYTMQTDFKFHKYFTVYNNVKSYLFFEGYNIFNRKNLNRVRSEWQSTDNYAEYYDRFGNAGGRYSDWSVWGVRRHFRAGVGLEF